MTKKNDPAEFKKINASEEKAAYRAESDTEGEDTPETLSSSDSDTDVEETVQDIPDEKEKPIKGKNSDPNIFTLSRETPKFGALWRRTYTKVEKPSDTATSTHTNTPK